MSLYLLHTYILLCTIATFQKAGTCLEAQQSMAKQPIKGCVSNHSRTCRRKCERKIRMNLKALEETSMLDNIKNFGKFFVSCRVSIFFGLLGFYLFMLLFKYQFDAGFSVFFLLISRIYNVFVGIKFLSDAILLCLFLYRTGNCCFLSRPIYYILEYYYFDVVKFYNWRPPWPSG